MARQKRYQRVRWARTSDGTWLRLPTGQPDEKPLSQEYRRENLSHKDDKVESILAETRDWHGRRLLLVKWKGYAESKATWELEWRFSSEELERWHEQREALPQTDDATTEHTQEIADSQDDHDDLLASDVRMRTPENRASSSELSTARSVSPPADPERAGAFDNTAESSSGLSSAQSMTPPADFGEAEQPDSTSDFGGSVVSSPARSQDSMRDSSPRRGRSPPGNDEDLSSEPVDSSSELSSAKNISPYPTSDRSTSEEGANTTRESDHSAVLQDPPIMSGKGMPTFSTRGPSHDVNQDIAQIGIDEFDDDLLVVDLARRLALTRHEHGAMAGPIARRGDLEAILRPHVRQPDDRLLMQVEIDETFSMPIMTRLQQFEHYHAARDCSADDNGDNSERNAMGATGATHATAW